MHYVSVRMPEVSDMSEKKIPPTWLKLLPRGKVISDLFDKLKELEMANVELASFGYTVAHDLSQPLTVITGYCQEIIEGRISDFPDEVKLLIEEVYENALTVNDIVDFMLQKSAKAQPESSCLATPGCTQILDSRERTEP